MGRGNSQINLLAFERCSYFFFFFPPSFLAGFAITLMTYYLVSRILSKSGFFSAGKKVNLFEFIIDTLTGYSFFLYIIPLI